MIIALFSMLGVWGIAALIKRFWLKELGFLFAIGIGLILAVAGATFQVFASISIAESSGIESDPMGLLRNAFITFCIAWYAAFQSLKK